MWMSAVEAPLADVVLNWLLLVAALLVPVYMSKSGGRRQGPFT